MVSKWYFCWHMHAKSLSVFETSEYNGHGGYDSKQDATIAARQFLIKELKELSDKSLKISSQLSSLVEDVNHLNIALVKLEE